MNLLRIAALVFTALSLVPGGAHLFELPGKIGLDRSDYFTVQAIYAGWALFAIPIFLAILANATLFVRLRRADRIAARWALSAALLILVSLAIFFARVFPANQATRNWTFMPADWEALRAAWEYGHAINAVLVFLAFVATSIAVVRR